MYKAICKFEYGVESKLDAIKAKIEEQKRKIKGKL
jgi:hypothetical protein